MSPLRFPLREGLRDPVEEAALARVWRGIDARVRRRHRRRVRMLPTLAAATALSVAAIVLYARHDPGPLRLADGRPVTAVDAPPAGAVVSMSDGSSIELGDGARFDPLESSSTSFVGVLERGSASFDVRPGGPRRWRIECGLATVEVVGTHFSCERDPGRLRVAVQRGAVLVSGERITNRVRRLTAGEALVVEESAPAPIIKVPAPVVVTAPAPAPLAAESDAPAAVGSIIRRTPKRPGVAELLAAADAARLSGRPADAEAPLRRILAEFAGDPQASLAAFALGRLELDSLGHPLRAAAALNRALELGIPQGLREDVRARLVEAYARAGNSAAAHAAAAAYAHEFPDGRHAKEIESRLER